MAEIKTYSEKELGDISFPRSKIQAEISELQVNEAGNIFIPGGKSTYKKAKVIVLILRDQDGD